MPGPSAVALDEETLNDLRREAERQHLSVPEYVRNLSALRRSARAFDLPVHIASPVGNGIPTLTGGIDFNQYTSQAMSIALLKGLGIFPGGAQPAAPAAPPPKPSMAESVSPYIELVTQLSLVRQLPKMLNFEEGENSPLRKALEEKTKSLEAELLKAVAGTEEVTADFKQYVHDTEKATIQADADRKAALLEAEKTRLEDRLAGLEERLETVAREKATPPPSLGAQMRELGTQVKEIQDGANALREIFPHPQGAAADDNSAWGKAQKIIGGINDAAASFAETYSRMQGNRQAGAYAGRGPPPQGQPPPNVPAGTVPANYAPEPPPAPQAQPRPAPPAAPRQEEVYIDPETSAIVTKAEYERKYPPQPAASPPVPPGAMGIGQELGEEAPTE